MRVFRDTRLVFQRSMWLTLHNPAWLAVGLLQPGVYLVLFAPLLKNLTGPGISSANAFDVFVPGLLVLNALFGSVFVGFGLLAELHAGVIERMRVTPVSRLALLLGRSLRDVVVLLVQGLILVALSVPFGFSIDTVGLVAVFGVLVLIGLVMSPFSYLLALALGEESAYAALINAIALPLMLLSGIILPMSLAPRWLRDVAWFNPLYHAVLAVRALAVGSFTDPKVLVGVGLMAVLAVVTLGLGARAFGRALT